MKPQAIDHSMNWLLDMASSQVSIKGRIIDKLAKQHAYGEHTVHKDTIEAYFLADDREAVDDALKELIRDPKSPVTTANDRKEITLTSRTAALDYLTKEGGNAEDIQYYHQLLHQAETGRLTDDSTTDPDISEGFNEETKYIVDELKQDNKESKEAAESWREEARRRQRLSLIVGIISLILGAILRHIAPLFF